MQSDEEKTEALWTKVRPNGRGLLPCIVQDLRTKEILMMAWVSQEALAQSLKTGWATFYSRSRRAIWQKGETSGNRQRLIQVRLDCDGDTLFYLVDAKLPACHEGTDTCFSRRRVGGAWLRDPQRLREGGSKGILQTLAELNTAVETTRDLDESSDGSPRNPDETGHSEEVLRSQSDALVTAIEREDDREVVRQSAEFLYSLAATLKEKKLTFIEVFQELERLLESKLESS